MAASGDINAVLAMDAVSVSPDVYDTTTSLPEMDGKSVSTVASPAVAPSDVISEIVVVIVTALR